MAARKLPYKEGSVFLVPLRDGGYARGVVARAGRHHHLLGYFFGPKLVAERADLEGLAPGQALWWKRFSDLGLLGGSWPVISSIQPWSREAWPIPEFLWSDPLKRLADEAVVFTNENFDGGDMLGAQERRVSVSSGLEPDGLAGYGYVELKLTMLLG